MADAVVKLKVESQEFDNKLARATQQLQHMEKEVRRTGASFEFADKEELAFIQSLGQMETKTQSVRYKLREYTESIISLTEMYQRLSDSEKNSDFGRGLLSSIDQIKKRAGELKDNMGDLDAEIKHLASDTSTFDSLAGGVNLMVSAFQVGQGIIQMFGVENENAVKSIAKLQGAMAVTNGLVQIQNALQKQSAVMLGVTTLQRKAAAAAAAIEAAAVGKGTVALKAATVAQKALNVASKANPYVLLATAVAAAGAALFAFTENSKDAKSAQEDLNDIQQNANQNSAEEIARINALNNILRDNTRHLDERKSALAEIQMLVPGYHGALSEEGTLIDDNSDALKDYIENLKKAAASQAAFDKLVELQAEKLDKQLVVQEKKSKYDAELKKLDKQTNSVVYKGTEYSIKYAKTSTDIAKGEWLAAQAEVDAIDHRIDNLYDLINVDAVVSDQNSNGIDTDGTEETIKTATDMWEEYLTTLQNIRDRIEELQAIINDPSSSKDKKSWASRQIEELTNKLNKLRGIKPKETIREVTANDLWEENSKKIAKCERLIGEFTTMLTNAKTEEQRTFATQMIEEYTSELNSLKNVAKEVVAELAFGTTGWSSDAISQYRKEIISRISSQDIGSSGYLVDAANLVDLDTFSSLLQVAAKNGITLDSNILENLLDDIFIPSIGVSDDVWLNLVDDINERLNELDIDPIVLDVKTGKISNVTTEITQDAKKSTEAWQQAANAVNNLGGALNNLEDPSAKVAGIIMQAVANIALGFAQATASKATGAAGVFGWIAAATAGLATMTATISSIKSVTKGGFANGGIVPGNSFSGDNLHTSDYGINSGELILNRAQQNTIASQLQGGAAQNMRLEALISGESLRMVLANNASRRGGNRAQYAISKFG